MTATLGRTAVARRPPPHLLSKEPKGNVFVPTISQLVLHGRQNKIKKVKAPAMRKN